MFQKSAHFSYKDPDSKYVRFCEQYCFCDELKAAVNNMQMNSQNHVPIKIYLSKQWVGRT